MRNPEAQFESGQKAASLSRSEVLELSPKEMVDYLTELEEKGELEVFLTEVVEDEALFAQLSYWEKWLGKDQQKLLDRLVEAKREAYGEKSESLPLELEKKYTAKELTLIFSNIEAIQLTFGCSKGCSFCGFDAIKKVREHIPYSQLANMYQKYGKELSKGEPFLYWASEPSDYASREGLEDRTYEDVHQLAVRYAGYDPAITSFNLADKKWMEFMSKSSSEKSERRLSVWGMTERSLQMLNERAVEAGGKIELYGEGYSHIKGMGKTVEEQKDMEDIPKAGIACKDGVLITPRGLFNMVVVPISKEYPQGTIIVPLEKISNETVKQGDRMKNVMRRSVIEGRFSHKGAVKKGESFQRYTGEFPKTVLVNTKDNKFCVSIDEQGVVLESVEYKDLLLKEVLLDAMEGKANFKFTWKVTQADQEAMMQWLETVDFTKIHPALNKNRFTWWFVKDIPYFGKLNLDITYDYETDTASGTIKLIYRRRRKIDESEEENFEGISIRDVEDFLNKIYKFGSAEYAIEELKEGKPLSTLRILEILGRRMPTSDPNYERVNILNKFLEKKFGIELVKKVR